MYAMSRPTNPLEGRVRVFSEEIKNTLEPTDIVGCFPHWPQGWIEDIQSEPTQCERVRKFLSYLLHERGSPTPGKFTSAEFTQFLDALQRAGYQPLKRKLQGEHVQTHGSYERILRLLEDEIARKIVINSVLLNDLVQSGVIGDEDKERVLRHGGSREAFYELKKCLPRRDVNWPDRFVEALSRSDNESVICVLFGIDESNFDSARIHKKNEDLKHSIIPDCIKSNQPTRKGAPNVLNNLSPTKSLASSSQQSKKGSQGVDPEAATLSFHLEHQSLREEQGVHAERDDAENTSAKTSDFNPDEDGKMFNKDLDIPDVKTQLGNLSISNTSEAKSNTPRTPPGKTSKTSQDPAPGKGVKGTQKKQSLSKKSSGHHSTAMGSSQPGIPPQGSHGSAPTASHPTASVPSQRASAVSPPGNASKPKQKRSPKPSDLDPNVWILERLPRQPGRRPKCRGCKKDFFPGDIYLVVKGMQRMKKPPHFHAETLFRFCPNPVCLRSIEEPDIVVEPPRELIVPPGVVPNEKELEILRQIGIPIKLAEKMP